VTKSGLAKGITRLLIVASVIWAAYCLFEVPREAAQEWSDIALAARVNGETQDADHAAHESDLVVQMKEHWASLYFWGFTLLPPVIAYCLSRLVLVIAYWIYSGFRTST